MPRIGANQVLCWKVFFVLYKINNYFFLFRCQIKTWFKLWYSSSTQCSHWFTRMHYCLAFFCLQNVERICQSIDIQCKSKEFFFFFLFAVIHNRDQPFVDRLFIMKIFSWMCKINFLNCFLHWMNQTIDNWNLLNL